MELEPQVVTWRHGDILLMMTDGVMNGYSGLNEEWLNRVVRRAPQRDLKVLSNSSCRKLKQSTAVRLRTI